MKKKCLHNNQERIEMNVDHDGSCMEPQHTPTPWNADGTIIQYLSKPGTHIATCDGWGTPQEANAAYIVKAVNCHEALIQELRDGALVADFIRENWESGDLARSVRMLMDWRNSAIKAIAKAEGK